MIKTTGDTTIITNKTGEETGRIENLKARMPRYNEVYGNGKCSTSQGSCPLWLVNYLQSSSYVTGEGVQNIAIGGYWRLSSYALDSKLSLYVTGVFSPQENNPKTIKNDKTKYNIFFIF